MLDPEIFYSYMPRFARSIALQFAGLRVTRSRYDRSFFRELRAAQTRAEMVPGERYHYVLEQLRAILSFHHARSEYYKELFRDYGVDPARITLEELSALPIQDKQVVKGALSKLTVQSPGEAYVHAHTSGTTGSGLRFPVDRTADHIRWATWWRFRFLHGITLNTWCSYFGGRTIVPPSYGGKRFWHTSHALRQVMYSMYHLGPGSVASYVEDLNRRQLPWIHGYPSTISYLAHLIEDEGLSLDYQPRWITLGAENVRADQVSIIKRVFGTRPIQHYGMAEPVANISEHRDGSLVVDEDYALVEFIQVEGQPNAYRIIGTSLYNGAMQFLRYDTGDIVTIPESWPREFTGEPRIVQSLDGRSEDFVFLPDGRRVGRLDHILKDIEEITESQFYQAADGHVVLRLVPGSGFDASTIKRIEHEWQSRLGTVVSFSVQTVEQIPRGPNGKLRFVRSEMGKRASM